MCLCVKPWKHEIQLKLAPLLLVLLEFALISEAFCVQLMSRSVADLNVPQTLFLTDTHSLKLQISVLAATVTELKRGRYRRELVKQI